MELLERKNVQIYPSKILCFPNDRFAKVLFNLTDSSFRDMTEGNNTHNLVEIRNHRKFGKIVSPYKIFADENAALSVSAPADQIDFAVLCVCISEWQAGNRHTTPAVIYRGLTGKVKKGTDAMPGVDQFAAIMNSINKLMSLRVDISMKDYCESLGCNKGETFQLVANLLPCEYASRTTVNGKNSTVIHFLDESPVWKIARLKNHQTLSFPIELLDVPNQNNTPLNIAVKHYALRRVIESIAHNKQLAPIITFADVFKKCRLENISRVKKQAVRETICDLFRHLIQCEIIRSFTLNKKSNAFYSVSFSYHQKPST